MYNMLLFLYSYKGNGYSLYINEVMSPQGHRDHHNKNDVQGLYLYSS